MVSSGSCFFAVSQAAPTFPRKSEDAPHGPGNLSHGEQDVRKLLDESIVTKVEAQISVNRRAPDGGIPSRKGRTSRLVKALLFLLISMFGLLGIRLFPSIFAEGWIPTVTVAVALSLLIAALIELVRTR